MGYKLINTSPKKVTKYLFIYFKVLFCQKSVIKFKNACYTNPHIHCMDNSSGLHLKAWCCNRMDWLPLQQGSLGNSFLLNILQSVISSIAKWKCLDATKSQTI